MDAKNTTLYAGRDVVAGIAKWIKGAKTARKKRRDRSEKMTESSKRLGSF